MALTATARSINVKRLELLEKLKTNRTKHAQDFEVAMEGYRIEVGKVLEKALDDFARNDNVFDDGLALYETAPENHTGEYDEVIAMMEMSVDEYINLDTQSFKQFVLDEWHWKQTFAATATKYVANVTAIRRGE